MNKAPTFSHSCITGNLMFAKLRKGGGLDHLGRWLDGLSGHKALADVAASHAPKGRTAKGEEKAAAGRGGGGEHLGLSKSFSKCAVNAQLRHNFDFFVTCDSSLVLCTALLDLMLPHRCAHASQTPVPLVGLNDALQGVVGDAQQPASTLSAHP